MNTTLIIDKLMPLAATAVWIAGVWSTIKKIAKGEKWSQQLLNLLAIGIGGMFVMNCMVVFSFVKVTIESVAGLISSFDLRSFLTK